MKLALTSSEAASLLDVHPSTVKRWCNDGELHSEVTPGGHRRIPIDTAVDFARSKGIRTILSPFRPFEPHVWAALKSVPPSIREAALGVGASKHQVMLHHVLPLAMPGILTGTIIGLAQALGETAPLLLIGMNAFIPSVENIGLTQPAMALPTQIFSWADSPERGFVSRTSAAIIVLLGFLVLMNLLAVYLRRRFEKKW